MNIVRVFPRRTNYTPTDDLAIVGAPPFWAPEAEEVHVSCTFTWDTREAYRLAGAWAARGYRVRVGGPALGGTESGFTPGLYVKPGVTFTSRGCDRRCPWCLVPEREGRLTLLEPIPPGWIVQDNNFAATPVGHRRKVYAMLAAQPHGAVFAGGIDARLVTPGLAAEFRDIRILDLFLACDSDAALQPLETALAHLAFLGRERLRCYVLVGFGGETLERAERRLRAVWELGAMPFAQLYQPPGRRVAWPADWRVLARTWSRPAGMKAAMKGAARAGALEEAMKETMGEDSGEVLSP